MAAGAVMNIANETDNRSGGVFRRSLYAALAGIALLAGCASDTLFKRAVAPPPPVQIEAGSTFTLKVPLMFAQESDALYFQDSQLVSAGGIAPELPYCKLTPARSISPRVIAPGTFAVVSVDYDDKESAAVSHTLNVTRIELVANATQPYTLSCQWPQDGPARTFLTSEQIEGAIGAHFSMALQR